MKEKFLQFLDKNISVFIFIILSFAFECLGIAYVGCKPIIYNCLYTLVIIGFVASICFLCRTKTAKLVICSVFLSIQIVANIGFIFLYDSNGTFFEWAMLSQRTDAAGTIEDLNLRWELLAILIGILLAFIISTIILNIKRKNISKTYPRKNGKAVKIFSIIMIFVCGFSMVGTPIFSNLSNNSKTYAEIYLYGDTSNKYQELGITANAVYEMFKGTLVDSQKTFPNDGVEDFVFNCENPLLETSKYNGISKDNNLIVILVESFEWYTFLQDYGHITKEQSLQLYPNLNKFLSETVYANNFHAREKTDTSEMLSMIGSNPTGKYINYDFENNSYPWSLPNLFKNEVIKQGNNLKQVKSFHQNTGSFYNRNTVHSSMGFEDFISIEDMAEYGVINTWNEEDFKGERNLDSETIQKLQNEMFPLTSENEQYMTFWLTFSMHGYYEERQTFRDQGYYDRLDEIGVFPKGISKKDDYLRTYAAAVLDLDKAIGIMMAKLEANNQLENTTIVMFSDHNTYYNNLSYHAKGIEERYNSELYRIPFMIYDQKLKQAYEADNNNSAITKFTTTADIIPTVLDLFGIKGWKNLYFGTSMFVEDVESIIYSRAYGIFVTDKLICYGAGDLIYKCEGFTDEDFESFIARAEKHLKKLEILDAIYYTNYFKDHEFKDASAI